MLKGGSDLSGNTSQFIFVRGYGLDVPGRCSSSSGKVAPAREGRYSSGKVSIAREGKYSSGR